MFWPSLSSRNPSTLKVPSDRRFAALRISSSASGQRRRSSDRVCSFASKDAKKRGSLLVLRCSRSAEVDVQRADSRPSNCSSLGRLTCLDQPLRSDRIATRCATRTLISSIFKPLSFFIFVVKELKYFRVLLSKD